MNKIKKTKKVMLIYFCNNDEGYYFELIGIIASNTTKDIKNTIKDCLEYYKIPFKKCDVNRIAEELINETEEIHFNNTQFKMEFELANQFIFNDYD